MDLKSYGTIAVRTYIAGGALPIENSIVRIRGAMEENRDIEYSLLTDNDGITKRISLPAPSISLSESPNPAQTPYYTYDVEILKEGFYPKKIFGVAMFANTDTTLPINMIPSPLFDSGVGVPEKNLNVFVYENAELE